MDKNTQRYERACDAAWASLNAANADLDEEGKIDTARWKNHIGPLRRALRALEADAPDATQLAAWVSERLEIYVSHIGWESQRRLQTRTETVATGLDHVATYGPAGRDIGWGLTPIPRYDHS